MFRTTTNRKLETMEKPVVQLAAVEQRLYFDISMKELNQVKTWKILESFNSVTKLIRN